MSDEDDEDGNYECDCGTCRDCDIMCETGYYPWQIEEMAKELERLRKLVRQTD